MVVAYGTGFPYMKWRRAAPPHGSLITTAYGLSSMMRRWHLSLHRTIVTTQAKRTFVTPNISRYAVHYLA